MELKRIIPKISNPLNFTLNLGNHSKSVVSGHVKIAYQEDAELRSTHCAWK